MVESADINSKSEVTAPYSSLNDPITAEVDLDEILPLEQWRWAEIEIILHTTMTGRLPVVIDEDSELNVRAGMKLVGK